MTVAHTAMVTRIASVIARGRRPTENHYAAARAILAELRTPTAGMISAGEDEIGFTFFADKPSDEAAVAVWSRMIGEALCDKQVEFDRISRREGDDG